MADGPLRLLLVDPDPVFRLGLRLCLEQFPDLEVVGDTDSGTVALEILQERTAASSETVDPGIDLVILDLGLGRLPPVPLSGLVLCQQLKTRYPALPILLVTVPQEPVLVTAALQAGVEGYCLKATPVPELMSILRQVAAGRRYVPQLTEQAAIAPLSTLPAAPEPRPAAFTLWQRNLRQSGLDQIDAALAELVAQAQSANLSALERVVLAGRQRELRAARWMVSRLLPASSRQTSPPTAALLVTPVASAAIAPIPKEPPSISPVQIASRTLQSTLFDAIVVRLQSNLQNLTSTPLEIDILREDKKRDLLYLVLRQFENLLEELQFSQLQPDQLAAKVPGLLRDLWQNTTTEFLGKYYTLSLAEAQQIEVVPVLLKDLEVVWIAILSKIPLLSELLSHLLFQTPLTIEGQSWIAGSQQALERAQLLLQNLLIQVANAVIQPLLNHFANVEAVKQLLFERRLLSTREVERFRNQLSWKYRLESLVGEPTAIFESRYWLLVLEEQGIQKRSIYSPRNQELEQLAGLQLTLTLALEARDAIAPRLRSAVSLVGSGLIYVLTEVIGRGIGLIGRGILQGIGNAWQDKRYKKSGDR